MKPDIKEINYSALKKLPAVMEMYGLFGNDAMILETMQRFNLKYLLSSDIDFDKISWIERMEAAESETE
ncbi:MAG: type II toxin-antitoxin system VapC family toxin [Epsilonproteobacteria bacterium]|nr:type II toxin-antitoxin system VapC family toxin [Campylobacterota bacterium]